MRAAIYARVSTPRQARAQRIDEQLERLKCYVEQKGLGLQEGHIYLDEGYSGASLNRTGLDALRDAAAMAEFEVILVAAPDRLARNYVHQVLLLEELQGRGCRVEFLERPMSQDPNDQLLLQIRGAVAEYERTLIAERMRRGRLAKLRSGQLLPWLRVPFGYRTDPERPRDPAGLRVEEYEAAIVRQMFAWYLEQGTTLGTIARRLTEGGVLTPTGKRSWSRSTIRGILKNPAYVGNAYGHCTYLAPAKSRRSPLAPVGAGKLRGLRAFEPRPHQLGRPQLLRVQGALRDRPRATLPGTPRAGCPARGVGVGRPVRGPHPPGARQARPTEGAR